MANDRFGIRKFVLPVAVVLAFAFTLYAVYLRRPTEEFVSYKVLRMVPEQRTISYPVAKILPNGRAVVETRVRTYTVVKPTWETKTRILEPKPIEKLRYWLLVGAAVFYGLYAAFVFSRWVSDKWKKRRSQDSEDTVNRLHGILTFVLGALTGVLAGADLSVDLEKEQAFADTESALSELDEKEGEIEHLASTLEEFIELLQSRILIPSVPESQDTTDDSELE